MTGGLSVQYTSNSQLAEITKARAEKMKDEKDTAELDTGLGAYIRRQWERNRRAKHEINYRLLGCLRARKGEYSIVEIQKILAYGAADPVYLKLTGTKSRAASSWIRDILLSPKHGEKPWSLFPSPIPHLPDALEKSVLEDHFPKALTSLAMTRTPDFPEGIHLNEDEMWKFKNQMKQEMLQNLHNIAIAACKNLELKVEDTLVKGDWNTALEEFIEDFVTYPFAVIKGPYYQKKKLLKWEDGKAVPFDQTHLCYRRVSPFDVFYSPYARTIQEGNLIERLRYTQDTLYQLIGIPGYREDHIRSVLELHKYGNLRDWIWEDFERDYLENNSPYFLSDRDTIDGLHYWGYVQGKDLITWGTTDKSVKDEQAMYPVEAILVGKHIIRCEINNNPMHWRPYHSATWDKVPGSLIGVSLPEQMEDHQRIVNATCRSLMTNLSIGSGPQAVVLTDMLADGENITNIFPLKIWQMRSSLTGNSGKPVEFFQPETNAEELMDIINTFEQKADDVTNVPRYSYGNEKIGGAGTTATGLSMLMNSAAKGIRRAIGNIDSGIIKPVVTQTFTEILRHDPDPSIKGDISVVSDGSASVLIREQLQANQKEFLQITSNPIDMQIMGIAGRAKLIKEIADEMGIDPNILPSDQELQQMDAEAKQQQQQMHQAQVNDLNSSQQGQGGQDQQALQQAMQDLQQKSMQLDQVEQEQQQQAAQVKQEEQQMKVQAQLVKKQSAAVDAEMKRLVQMKKAVEDQMNEIIRQREAIEVQTERDRLQRELEHERHMADLEKAKLELDTKRAEIKASAAQVKAQNEEKPTSKEESNSKVDGALKEALKTLSETVKAQQAPRSIRLVKDEKGKLQGVDVLPTKSD